MYWVQQYPCVVWHHSLSRNVALWNIYNFTWNMACVTHIWVNVKEFDNLRISSEFLLYEFAAALSVLKYYPKNIRSELDSDSGRVGITDLKQVSSLTSLRPGRPRPGLSDSLLLGKFSLHHLITAGARPQSQRTDGHQAAKWIQLQRELFNDNICLYLSETDVFSRAWGVRGSKGDQSGTKERGKTTYLCVPGAGGGGLGRLQS